MRYPSTSKQSPHNITTILIGILLVGVLVFGIDRFAPHIFSDALGAVIHPVLQSQTLNDSFFGDVVQTFESKRQLQQENESLRRQVRDQRTELLALSVIKEQNKQLQSRLNRSTSTSQSVYARVVARPSRTPYDTLLVDVGRDEGLRVGDRVTVRDSVLLGEVVSVSDASARVKLYSSPQTAISVQIGSEDPLSATARGAGGGNFRIQLPQGVDVKEGANILDMETGKYIIGTVEEVTESSESFQWVLSRSPVNVNELFFVDILIDG